MFSNPLVALMVMLMLCFAGMLIMFLFVIRFLNTLAQTVREQNRRQQALLTDIENTVMEMNFSLQRLLEKPRGKGNSNSLSQQDAEVDLTELMETLSARKDETSKNGNSIASNEGQFPKLKFDTDVPADSQPQSHDFVGELKIKTESQ